MKRLLTAMTLGLLIAACDHRSPSPIPTAASPVPPPAAAPTPAPIPQTLVGYVGDTAFRVLPGVTVEVTKGPEAGMVMTSDAQGRFSYTGTFATPVTLRASKDGYAVGNETAIMLTSGGAYVSFVLAALAPTARIAAGHYTLTISAGAACAGLPDDVRTRTYAATLTPGGNAHRPANTYFNGTVTGGQYAPYANTFWIGIAGDYVAVSTEGEGPSLVEQVGPTRYIAFTGSAGVTVETSDVSSISAPFKGLIEYCELKGPLGSYYECPAELAAVREQCTSDDGQLTLAPR